MKGPRRLEQLLRARMVDRLRQTNQAEIDERAQMPRCDGKRVLVGVNRTGRVLRAVKREAKLEIEVCVGS